MSGAGRRSQYRKHLTDSVLNDLPEPDENERIAKIVGTRGGNQYDVILGTNEDFTNRTPQLAILPTKFRKLVWIKRNDYVIVQTGGDKLGDERNDADESTQAVSGIRYMIAHILYKEQVKHLQTKKLWPLNDPEFALTDEPQEQTEDVQGTDDDGIVYDQLDDDDIFVNTNRRRQQAAPNSSDSEDSDDD